MADSIILKLAKKNIEDVDVKGKRVLVRVDFDVPTDESRAIIDEKRITAAIPTIKYAIERGAQRVVLISHLGRPNGARNAIFSLAIVAERLGEILNKTVTFLEDCVGDMVEAACADLAFGSIVLLENLQFRAEEQGTRVAHCEGCNGTACSDDCKPIKLKREDIELFRGQLDALGDIYVNDAFRLSHLSYSSIVGVDLPDMVAGLSMKDELVAFSRVLAAPVRPSVAVVGGICGAGLAEQIELVASLVGKVDCIIICGSIAFTFLKVCDGMQIGSSPFDCTSEHVVQGILDNAKAHDCAITFPVDWLLRSKECNRDQEPRLVEREQGIPQGWEAMDCGPQSVELFTSKLCDAKTVLWHGPPGNVHVDIFSKGTHALLEVVAATRDRGGFSMVCDRDTAEVAAKWGMLEKVSFASVGGSASLALLKGRCLPGIAVLANAPRTHTWLGAAAGKYQWEDARRGRDADLDVMQGEPISKYSWSDGRKRVSIYIELDGLDEVPEDAFTTSAGKREVSLTIQSVMGRRRTFSIANLQNDITDAKVVQKKGKNMLSLQLQKQVESSWTQLVDTSGRSNENDDAMDA